ncbi:hypothetical protein CBR_g19222 [Chara braunii]|uniref:Carbohydrate kinase PfkB domain-containing protein n=1 Tax=Chara braunii TaxID=69332 RepID=A0A388JTL4_CHABU|nr:hypothetical protein CBR_g19222 [Chara braunii]|eukprot:GBG61146.1 hypothetical protein CBR_g19222 [Chara braunii]
MLGRISALHSTSKSSVQQDSGVDSATGQRDKMPPLPEKRVVVGCGSVGIDYLASVAKYPNPDDKIRTEDFASQGGGNAGNALTAAARLGLKPHILSKVADDSTGKLILEELENDGVDTKHVVVSEGGVSPFTYIIVDKETKTRTCIHTPGSPAMRPEELTDEAISSVLADASIVYFDVRLWETAIKLAKEAEARGLPILVDAEKRRDGLDELLSSATYIVAAAKFPQHWTGETTLPDALLQMMIKLPGLQFVIVTLGADGCVMLRRESDNNNNSGATMPGVPELDIGKTLDELKDLAQKRRAEQSSQPLPVVVSSTVGRLMPSSPHSSETQAERTGVFGTLIYGTAVMMTPEEIVDTTGAGDAFIGAVLYALCAGMSASSTLTLAATVASAKCRAMGARAGLPFREDSRVVNLLY